MKITKYLYLLGLGFAASCSNEKIIYDDEPVLTFYTASSQQLVDQGSGSKIVELKYGTLAKVDNAEVKLVVDPSSQLKEGTDFQIMGTSNPSGKFDGTISIKLLESGASPEGKNAVFRLQSPTIKNGILNPVHTMTVALKCPVTAFVGNFQTKTALFASPYNINIVAGTAPNTLVLKDYIAVGTDIIVNYDPNTGAVTFPTQSTGYMNGAVNVQIKQAVDGSASKVNFCTRKLDLRVTYGPPGGNYSIGGQTSHTETSTGI